MRKNLILFSLLLLIPMTGLSRKLTRDIHFETQSYSKLTCYDGSTWKITSDDDNVQLMFGALTLNGGTTMSIRSDEVFPADVKVTIYAGGTEAYDHDIYLTCDGHEETVTSSRYNDFHGSWDNIQVEEYTFNLRRNMAETIDITLECSTTLQTAYLIIAGITLEYDFIDPLISKEGEVTYDGNGEGLGKDVENVTDANIPQGGYIAGNILYTLGKDDGYGKDEETGKKVVYLNTPINGFSTDNIGSPGYAEQFKGLTCLLPAGTGSLYLTARTYGDAVLNVKLGDRKPQTFVCNDEYQEVEIPYALTKDTYVFIYHSIATAGANQDPRAPGKKMTTTTGLQRMRVRASSVGSTPPPVTTPKTIHKEDIVVVDGHIIIDDPDVTAWDYDIFDDVKDQEITYIDFSKTSIQNTYIYRNDYLPFCDIPVKTFIYLPYSNRSNNPTNVVIGDVCQKVELGDDPFEVAHDFTAEKVVLNRDLSKWPEKTGTICLPFALDKDVATEIGTFYDLAAIQDQKVCVTEATSVVANKPYILKATVDKLEVDMVDFEVPYVEETARRATTEPQLVGVFKPTVLTSDAYVFDEDGKFSLVTTATTVAPFQAYIKAPGATVTPLEIRIGLPDGIHHIQLNVDTADIYYDLQGRRLIGKPVNKGVYIHQGRCVLVK